MSQAANHHTPPVSDGLAKRGPDWLAVGATAGALVATVFQAWAYYSRLTLSLGPRMVLQPWLLRQGYTLYENIVDLHSPLAPMALSALGFLVPDGLKLAKWTLVTLISVTTLLTFVTGQRKTGWLGGLFAACFFVLWSPAFGFGKLWYETFLAPIYLVWLLAYRPSRSIRSTWSLVLLGLLGGIAVLIKQQAALVFMVFAFWLTLTDWHCRRSLVGALRELVVLGLAALAPVAIYLVYQYAHVGSLASTLYWLVGYPLSGGYSSLTTILPSTAKAQMAASCFLLVPAALVCAVGLKRNGDDAWWELGLGLLLLASGAITAYPRFEMFHLQAALPVAAVVSCMTLAGGMRLPKSDRFFAVGIALALSLFWLLTQGPSFRPVIHQTGNQRVYEYSDLLPLAQEVRSYTGGSGCVYIFPDDEASANLYYLLQCTPPKFWALNYSWYMFDWVKAKTIQTLEQEPPEWVAYFPDFWDAKQSASEIAAYIDEHYVYVASLHWAQGEVQLLKRKP